jgi:hypothetical protein
MDRLKQQGQLKDRKFTASGYGLQQPEFGKGAPTFADDTFRRYAIESFDALNDAWLRLSQKSGNR